MLRKSLKINAGDNVAMVLEDAVKGDTIRQVLPGDTSEQEIVLVTDVEFAHKVALQDFAVGDPVIKYGEIIGRASRPIRRGEWIHGHNLECRRGEE